MEDLHVNPVTFGILGFCALAGAGMFLGLFIACRKRGGGRILPFWVGCGSFFLFAMVLESLCHQLVLRSSVGPAILGNTWGYAIYGGLAAGIFEETGRLVAMGWLKKKNCGPNTDLVYGAGHGGIEVLLVLCVSMVQYIVYGVLINTGKAAALLSTLDEANWEAAMAVFQQLSGPAPWMSLLSVVERLSAIVIHLSLSVLVWKAVMVPGKLWLYPAAIALHALADAVLVLFSRLVGSLVLTEIVVAVVAACLALLACRIRRIQGE